MLRDRKQGYWLGLHSKTVVESQKTEMFKGCRYQAVVVIGFLLESNLAIVGSKVENTLLFVQAQENHDDCGRRNHQEHGARHCINL